MDEFIVAAYPQLSEPASTKVLEGTLAWGYFTVGAMRLDTPNGIAYRVELTNTGEGIVLSGTASCTATTECTRCLKPTNIDIEGQVEGYFLLQPAEELEGYERDEFECVDADGNFDIAPAIHAALVYATPYARTTARGFAPSAEQISTRAPASATLQTRTTPIIRLQCSKI